MSGTPRCGECAGCGWVYVVALDGEREKESCPMGCEEPKRGEPSPSLGTYADQMRVAGRGHLLRGDER